MAGAGGAHAVGFRITAYGGVGEIGGNAFILDDGATRVSLDFGMQFGGPPLSGERSRRPGQNDFFDSFVRPRAPSAVRDLMSLGLLPAMPEVYRSDVGGDGSRPFDAVLLSHPHADHHGYISYLAPQTPLHMSRTAAFTLAHVQGVGTGDASSQFVDVKRQGTTRRRGRKHQAVQVEERPIAVDPRFQVGAWDIERFDVDHSIHGAGAYILQHRDGTRVAYSGDLRMHGRHPERTRRFLQAAQDSDVLLVEGTRVGHHHGSHASGPEERTEHDVRHEVRAILEQLDASAGGKFAALAYPIRDMDRLQSLHEARGDRVLVIQDRQAHLLWHLREGCGMDFLPDPCTDPGLRIHAPEGHDAPDPWDDPQKDAGLSDWASTMYFRHFRENRIPPERTVTNREVAQDPAGYLLTLNYWNITNLIDILPPGPDNGVFIRSQTQPFNDEMLLLDQKLRLWLDLFGLRIESTHVSGHIGQGELFAALEDIRPKSLVPIHSEHPELTIHHADGLGIPTRAWAHGQTLQFP